MQFLKPETTKNPTLVNNFYFSFMLSVINGLVNVIYPLIIGISLGPVQYASFAILLAIINLFILLNESVLLPSSIRFISSALDETKNAIYSSNWLIYFSLLIVAFFIFILGQSFFTVSTTQQFLIFSVLLIFITLHRYLRSIYQGLELYQHLVTIEILSLSIGFISGIFFVFSFHSWQSLFYPLIVYHLAFIFLSAFSYNILKFKFTFDIDIIKKILRYGFFVGLGSLFSLGLTQYQIIFTSNEFTKLNTGQVAFWAYFVFPFTIFILSLTNAIFPRMVKLSLVDELKVFNIITTITKYLIFTSISIVILLNLVILNVNNLNIHFLNLYFENNGLELALIYFIYGGGLVIFYSLVPLFSVYENRIFINSILPFILLLISVLIWNSFLSLKNIIIIPIGLLCAVFTITMIQLGFIAYYEKFDIKLFVLILFYYVIQVILIYFNVLSSIVNMGILFTIIVSSLTIILLFYTLFNLLIHLRESNIHVSS